MPLKWNIEILDTVGSTQTELKNRQNLCEGDVIQALNQTNGHGRHMRQWDSGQGNLTFSFALKPNAEKRYYGLIALICGLAIYDAVVDLLKKSNQRYELMLKWPNDLLLNEKKLAGILIEADEDTLHIGIGVNVSMAPANIGIALDTVFLEKNNIFELRDEILKNVYTYYKQWKEGLYGHIISEWKKAAHKKGKSLSVKTPQKIIHGQFYDLDPYGNLLLSQEGKQVTTISVGDVHIGFNHAISD